MFVLTTSFTYENVRVSLLWPLRLCTFGPQTSYNLPVCSLSFCRVYFSSLPHSVLLNLIMSCSIMWLRFCISRPLCLESLFSLLPHRSEICLIHSAVPEADVIVFGRTLIGWLLPILAWPLADGVILYLLMSVFLTGL